MNADVSLPFVFTAGTGLVREGLVRARAFRDGHAYDHVMFGLVDPQRLRDWMRRGRLAPAPSSGG